MPFRIGRAKYNSHSSDLFRTSLQAPTAHPNSVSAQSGVDYPSFIEFGSNNQHLIDLNPKSNVYDLQDDVMMGYDENKENDDSQAKSPIRHVNRFSPKKHKGNHEALEVHDPNQHGYQSLSEFKPLSTALETLNMSNSPCKSQYQQSTSISQHIHSGALSGNSILKSMEESLQNSSQADGPISTSCFCPNPSCPQHTQHGYSLSNTCQVQTGHENLAITSISNSAKVVYELQSTYGDSDLPKETSALGLSLEATMPLPTTVMSAPLLGLDLAYSSVSTIPLYANSAPISPVTTRNLMYHGHRFQDSMIEQPRAAHFKHGPFIAPPLLRKAKAPVGKIYHARRLDVKNRSPPAQYYEVYNNNQLKVQEACSEAQELIMLQDQSPSPCTGMPIMTEYYTPIHNSIKSKRRRRRNHLGLHGPKDGITNNMNVDPKKGRARAKFLRRTKSAMHNMILGPVKDYARKPNSDVVFDADREQVEYPLKYQGDKSQYINYMDMDDEEQVENILRFVKITDEDRKQEVLNIYSEYLVNKLLPTNTQIEEYTQINYDCDSTKDSNEYSNVRSMALLSQQSFEDLLQMSIQSSMRVINTDRSDDDSIAESEYPQTALSKLICGPRWLHVPNLSKDNVHDESVAEAETILKPENNENLLLDGFNLGTTYNNYSVESVPLSICISQTQSPFEENVSNRNAILANGSDSGVNTAESSCLMSRGIVHSEPSWNEANEEESIETVLSPDHSEELNHYFSSREIRELHNTKAIESESTQHGSRTDQLLVDNDNVKWAIGNWRDKSKRLERKTAYKKNERYNKKKEKHVGIKKNEEIQMNKMLDSVLNEAENNTTPNDVTLSDETHQVDIELPKRFPSSLTHINASPMDIHDGCAASFGNEAASVLLYPLTNITTKLSGTDEEENVWNNTEDLSNSPYTSRIENVYNPIDVIIPSATFEIPFTSIFASDNNVPCSEPQRIETTSRSSRLSILLPQNPTTPFSDQTFKTISSLNTMKKFPEKILSNENIGYSLLEWLDELEHEPHSRDRDPEMEGINGVYKVQPNVEPPEIAWKELKLYEKWKQKKGQFMNKLKHRNKKNREHKEYSELLVEDETTVDNIEVSINEEKTKEVIEECSSHLDTRKQPEHTPFNSLNDFERNLKDDTMKYIENSTGKPELEIDFELADLLSDSLALGGSIEKEVLSNFPLDLIGYLDVSLKTTSETSDKPSDHKDQADSRAVDEGLEKKALVIKQDNNIPTAFDKTEHQNCQSFGQAIEEEILTSTNPRYEIASSTSYFLKTCQMCGTEVKDIIFSYPGGSKNSEDQTEDPRVNGDYKHNLVVPISGPTSSSSVSDYIYMTTKTDLNTSISTTTLTRQNGDTTHSVSRHYKDSGLNRHNLGKDLGASLRFGSSSSTMSLSPISANYHSGSSGSMSGYTSSASTAATTALPSGMISELQTQRIPYETLCNYCSSAFALMKIPKQQYSHKGIDNVLNSYNNAESKLEFMGNGRVLSSSSTLSFQEDPHIFDYATLSSENNKTSRASLGSRRDDDFSNINISQNADFETFTKEIDSHRNVQRLSSVISKDYFDDDLIPRSVTTMAATAVSVAAAAATAAVVAAATSALAINGKRNELPKNEFDELEREVEELVRGVKEVEEMFMEQMKKEVEEEINLNRHSIHEIGKDNDNNSKSGQAAKAYETKKHLLEVNRYKTDQNFLQSNNDYNVASLFTCLSFDDTCQLDNNEDRKSSITNATDCPKDCHFLTPRSTKFTHLMEREMMDKPSNSNALLGRSQSLNTVPNSMHAAETTSGTIGRSQSLNIGTSAQSHIAEQVRLFQAISEHQASPERGVNGSQLTPKRDWKWKQALAVNNRLNHSEVALLGLGKSSVPSVSVKPLKPFASFSGSISVANDMPNTTLESHLESIKSASLDEFDSFTKGELAHETIKLQDFEL